MQGKDQVRKEVSEQVSDSSDLVIASGSDKASERKLKNMQVSKRVCKQISKLGSESARK